MVTNLLKNNGEKVPFNEGQYTMKYVAKQRFIETLWAVGGMILWTAFCVSVIESMSNSLY
tara:strand:+ start:755 stop:934 length:180 start_codon:yes stop_codon:yes gene_type:complete